MLRRIPLLSWLIPLFLTTVFFATLQSAPAQRLNAADFPARPLAAGQAVTSTLFLPTIAAQQPLIEMSPEDRMAAIEAIDQVVESVLPAPDTPTDQRDFVAEVEKLSTDLLALPQIVTTYVSTVTLTVNAVLTDGLTVAIVNNRPPESTVSTATLQSAAPAFAPAPPLKHIFPRQTSATGLPGSDRAVSVAFDGGGAVAAQVANLLRDSGYTVLSLGASLGDMRQYKNLGALYLDTHGVSYLRVTGYTLDKDGNVEPTTVGNTYAIQTSSQVDYTALSNAANREDLRQGRLAIAWVQKPDGWDAKIAITPRFIETYWQLDDAVVMLHACFSGSGPFIPYERCKGRCQAGQPGVLDPTPFQQSIVNAGAAVLIGFDNFTNADVGKESILYFWDRLLGRNTQQPPSPPARPFDWSQVRTEMDAKKLLTFRVPSFVIGPLGLGGNSVNLNFFFNKAPHGGAPSIKRLLVKDDATASQGEVELHGVFPAKAGSVTVDNQPAAVKSWGQEKIVINTPFSGNGAAGSVIVKGPGNVKSNPAPLTEWAGTVTYSFIPGQGNLRAASTLTVRFRADLHPYRETLASDPVQTPVTVYPSGASSGYTDGSGSHSEDGVTVSYADGGAMTLYANAAVDTFGSNPAPRSAAGPVSAGGIFGGRVTLDAKQRTAKLCLVLQGNFQQMISSEGQTQTLPGALILPGPEGLADSRQGFLDCFNLTMNGDYSLAAGSRQVTEDGATFRLHWSRFDPVNPPTANDPG